MREADVVLGVPPVDQLRERLLFVGGLDCGDGLRGLLGFPVGVQGQDRVCTILLLVIEGQFGITFGFDGILLENHGHGHLAAPLLGSLPRLLGLGHNFLVLPPHLDFPFLPLIILLDIGQHIEVVIGPVHTHRRNGNINDGHKHTSQ
jgi:hypothetical protein